VVFRQETLKEGFNTPRSPPFFRSLPYPLESCVLELDGSPSPF
jgi:hypothetical protein